ncbi:hypothetical protein LINPERPRIM_LOCUS25556 [Linum perenne]
MPLVNVLMLSPLIWESVPSPKQRCGEWTQALTLLGMLDIDVLRFSRTSRL